MSWAPIRGLCIGVLVLGGCGGDDGDEKTSSTTVSTPPSPAAVPPGPASAAPDLKTAKAVADAISAAGLGCDDRQPEAPEPAPDFPAPSEILLCTVSVKEVGAREIGITVYANQGDPERARTASSKVLCGQIGKAETEKRTAVYGKYHYVGTATGDPAVAAAIAQATGGEVKNFTCS